MNDKIMTTKGWKQVREAPEEEEETPAHHLQRSHSESNFSDYVKGQSYRQSGSRIAFASFNSQRGQVEDGISSSLSKRDQFDTLMAITSLN